MKQITNRQAERFLRHQIKYLKDLGIKVIFQKFVEDAETPGLIGQFAGIYIKELKKIKIRLYGMSYKQLKAIIEHEIEHVEGKDKATDHPGLKLHCGGTGKGLPFLLN